MIEIIEQKLKELKTPVSIILVGLGFIGLGFLLRIMKTQNLHIPIIITRDIKRSSKILNKHGINTFISKDPLEIQLGAKNNQVCLWDDYNIIKSLDYKIVVEMTGSVSYGAEVALAAFDSNKHLATMNVELQSTIGSYLKKYADDRGLLITDMEGDQPGNLSTFQKYVKFLGFKPIMAGNIKGFLNRYATPDTIEFEAAKRGLSLKQATSFTDGTKIALEMSLVSNYFNLELLITGMHGYHIDQFSDIEKIFDWSSVPAKGCVDYITSKELPPGIFLVCEHKDIEQAKYLNYLKLGFGPRYLLYQPYHLCHLEAVLTVTKLALFETETINNSRLPSNQVNAYAKSDLKTGEILDGIGGRTCYGLISKYSDININGPVPIGLTSGARIIKPIKKDSLITMDKIKIIENEASRLWYKQNYYIKNNSYKKQRVATF